MKLTAEQIACLSSPTRIQLYESLRSRHQASVDELAADLGKSVHSMYYHVKAMTDVGLIRVAEYRKSGKRNEAVYEPISTRLVVDQENNSVAYTKSLIKTVRLTLRKAEQEHRAARESENPSELFCLLRLQANLSEDDIKTVRAKLKSLGQWIRKRDQKDPAEDVRPFAMTCVGVPLERES